MSTQSLASVKARFSAVVDSVRATHERVTVTRNGEPAVVLVAVDDLESLELTLEILRDEATMRALANSDRAIEAGDVLNEAALRDLMAQRRRDR